MGITLKEVAKMAKVSVSTVSNIVNNKGKSYSDETRDKVLKILEEHKYRPNSAARALSGKKVRNIGLIVRDVTRPFYAEIAKAVEKESFEKNYNLWICNTDGDFYKKRAYMETVVERGLDGIIFASLVNVVQEELQAVSAYAIPVIILDDTTKIKGCYNISVNHYAGVLKSTRYLIEKGHEKIAYVGGDPVRNFTRERIDGYQQAMGEAGLRKEIVSYHDLTNNNLRKVESLINKGYTAIVAHNDNTAFWIYTYCQKNNIEIPKQLSIVGFDDLRLAKIIEPGLTTIKQPLESIAGLALDYIDKKLQGQPPAEQVKLITPQLIERSSVEFIHSKNLRDKDEFTNS